MGRVLEAIPDDLARWLEAQPVFFVATAPADPDTHVNLSPRGLDAFRVLDPLRAAWLDLTGSGIETIAHLRADGRITLMFCAFAGPPQIVRLHGRGTVHELGSPGFAELAERFPDLPGARAVIDVAVTRVSTSCGYAVPRMELVGERDTLNRSNARKGAEVLARYRADRNDVSIDGLPGYLGPPTAG